MRVLLRVGDEPSTQNRHRKGAPSYNALPGSCRTCDGPDQVFGRDRWDTWYLDCQVCSLCANARVSFAADFAGLDCQATEYEL
jgi:hypothetical protein